MELARYTLGSTISSDHATDSADYLLSQFYILMGLALVQIILDLLTHSQELGDLKSLRKVEPQLIMEQTGVVITVVVNQRAAFDGTGPRQDGYAHSGSALTINFPLQDYQDVS